MSLQDDNTEDQKSFETSVNERSVKSLELPANYFDIGDILAMNERVPCQVEHDLVKMGFLDQSTDDEHLAKGTKLELPIWFAKEFHTDKAKVFKIDTPKGYNLIYRQIFEADASVVDLNKICPNFYKFGEHLIRLEISKRESEEIGEMLENTFYQRIQHILMYSLNKKSESVTDGINFKKRIDNLEMQLYEIGRRELDQIEKWETNKLNKIDTNEFVANLMKRKQAAASAGLH